MSTATIPAQAQRLRVAIRPEVAPIALVFAKPAELPAGFVPTVPTPSEMAADPVAYYILAKS